MSYTFIPGKSHPVGTEAETLNAVRSALTEFEDEKPVLPTVFGGKPRLVRRSKAELFAPLAEDDDTGSSEKLSSLRERMGFNGMIEAPKRLAQLPIPERLKQMSMPKRKHVAFALMAALILIRPMWAFFAVLIVVSLVALAFFTLGAETIWRGVMLALHQLSDKDPKRAVRIRKRLDAFAVKWDTFLDRFPEGSVDQFYMPDFQVLSAEEARNEARFQNRMEEG